MSQQLSNFRWIADEWGPCTKKCGGGKKLRIIVCAEESNGNRHRVPDEACRGIPPRIEEACNPNECPKWVPTEWSGVGQNFYSIYFKNKTNALTHVKAIIFTHTNTHRY